ncbi:hypothetical protein VZG28_04890 [Synechococcus elongatus IITB4]|uniref:hypothetical protein n=1 Tax=Synechococcus elongatus TaxID=32046 RepID=UPI0030CEC1BD
MPTIEEEMASQFIKFFSGQFLNEPEKELIGSRLANLSIKAKLHLAESLIHWADKEIDLLINSRRL